MSFPRNYSYAPNEVNRIREFYRERLDRPCYIVGNGPSSAEVNLSQSEQESAIIFRMNWFFLEEDPTYGCRVDGFFCSIENKGLLKEVAKIQKNGPYQIEAFFQPFSQDSADGSTAVQNRFLTPSFDHWALIASNNTLARFMMGRPLPTQGMQALAFAAALGFKDIRLSGIDMYSDASKRYAWDIPDEVSEHLQSKDINPGYESNHSLELDLMFLRAIRSNFDFHLTGMSRMEILAPYLDKKTSIQTRNLSPIIPTNSANPREKFAYATFVEGSYVLGAIALARSLSKLTDIPLVVLHHELDIGHTLSKLPNVVTKQIEPLKNPHLHGQQRFASTYSKLRAFDLLEYDRVVFLDSDCVVLKPIDDLFHTDGFCAAPDWGNVIHSHFNSGVFAFSPSPELRDHIYSGIEIHPSSDGGDQGFLNIIFADEWRPLPPEYNTLKRLLTKHPNLINLADVRVLHFVGHKPWLLDVAFDQYDYLVPFWADFLEPEDWRIFYWMSRNYVLRQMKKRLRSASRRQSNVRMPSSVRRLGRRLVPEPLVYPAWKFLNRIGAV